MKKLVSTLVIVAALCAVLAVPTAAGKPVEVSGWFGDGDPDYFQMIEQRPIGKGENDHYCLITLQSANKLYGQIEGDLYEHAEILVRGPCWGGPASAPSEQKAWGTFEGQVWDGEKMREGTCKTFWRGGWYYAEDGETLIFGGKEVLHTCTGELKGAHVEFDEEWMPPGEDTYTGRAFFSSAP
jgi:hypothetical protein